MNIAITYILISVLGGAIGQILLKKGMNIMGAMTLSIVNPTSQPQKVALAIKGIKLAGAGTLKYIADSDPQAYNDPGQPPKVVIQETRLNNLSAGLTVPALSINLCTVPVEGPQRR